MATQVEGIGRSALAAYLEQQVELRERVDERLEAMRQRRREERLREVDGRLERQALEALARRSMLRAAAERELYRAGVLRDLYL